MVGGHRPKSNDRPMIHETFRELQRFKLTKLENIGKEAPNIRFKNGPTFARSKFHVEGQSVNLWLANPTLVLDVGIAQIKSLTTENYLTVAAGDVETVEEQHYEKWSHSVHKFDKKKQPYLEIVLPGFHPQAQQSIGEYVEAVRDEVKNGKKAQWEAEKRPPPIWYHSVLASIKKQDDKDDLVQAISPHNKSTGVQYMRVKWKTNPSTGLPLHALCDTSGALTMEMAKNWVKNTVLHMESKDSDNPTNFYLPGCSRAPDGNVYVVPLLQLLGFNFNKTGWKSIYQLYSLIPVYPHPVGSLTMDRFPSVGILESPQDTWEFGAQALQDAVPDLQEMSLSEVASAISNPAASVVEEETNKRKKPTKKRNFISDEEEEEEEEENRHCPSPAGSYTFNGNHPHNVKQRFIKNNKKAKAEQNKLDWDVARAVEAKCDLDRESAEAKIRNERVSRLQTKSNFLGSLTPEEVTKLTKSNKARAEMKLKYEEAMKQLKAAKTDAAALEEDDYAGPEEVTSGSDEELAGEEEEEQKENDSEEGDGDEIPVPSTDEDELQPIRTAREIRKQNADLAKEKDMGEKDKKQKLRPLKDPKNPMRAYIQTECGGQEDKKKSSTKKPAGKTRAPARKVQLAKVVKGKKNLVGNAIVQDPSDSSENEDDDDVFIDD